MKKRSARGLSQTLVRKNYRTNYRARQARAKAHRLKESFGFLKKIGNWFRFSRVLTVVFVLMGGFIVFALWSPYFQIKNIQIIRDNPNFDIARMDLTLESVYGSNMILLSESELIENLKLEFPQFESVSIKEKWPSDLILDIQIAQPFVNVLNTEDASFQVISDTGIILSEDSQDSLDTIEIYQHPKPLIEGELLIEPDVLNHVFTTKQKLFQELGIFTSEIHYYFAANEIHYITKRNTALWFDVKEDFEMQLEKLAVSLEEIGYFDRQYEYIDLRIPEKIFYKRR